jgi:flap endonuclease-1
MGVNIANLVEAQKFELSGLKGKTIAVDAYNTLYQFLSIIRQPDGTPLKDSKNRVTSHLSGLLYRNVNLLDAGIKPIYVFDGEPHELKSGTIEDRIHVREAAREEWKIALEEGDLKRAKSKAQQTSRLTKDMVEDSKMLLKHLGIPYLSAPSDGEAQASYMVKKGEAWGACSQDFDSLLFGAPILVRNLTLTGRRKLPGRDQYINVVPEKIELEDVLKTLEITREQLVDMGILVGTDFNEGVKGIGPKKALKLLKKHKTLEDVMKEKKIEIENFIDIRSIFLNPSVTDDYELSFGTVNKEKVTEMLVEEFDFSEARVLSSLNKLEKAEKARAQTSLENWS